MTVSGCALTLLQSRRVGKNLVAGGVGCVQVLCVQRGYRMAVSRIGHGSVKVKRADGSICSHSVGSSGNDTLHMSAPADSNT